MTISEHIGRCLRLAFGPVVLAWSTGAVTQTVTADTIQAQSALIDVVEQIEIPARSAGVLERLEVREGDSISEGQNIAEVEAGDAKLAYQRARIDHELSLELAKSDVAIRYAKRSHAYATQQHSRLTKANLDFRGSVSQSELDESLMKAEQAALDLEKARQDLNTARLDARLKEADAAIAQYRVDICQVTSPLRGVVVEVLKHRGEWVEPGDPLLRVMRIDRLQADGLVNVADVRGELLGGRADVTVSLPGHPPMTTQGEVVYVSPDINPVSGQLRVRVEFSNPNNDFRPGMRAEMAIQVPKASKDNDPALTRLAAPPAP